MAKNLEWPGMDKKEEAPAKPEVVEPKHVKEEGPTLEDNRNLFFEELKKRMSKAKTDVDAAAVRISDTQTKLDIKVKPGLCFGSDQTIDLSKLPK